MKTKAGTGQPALLRPRVHTEQVTSLPQGPESVSDEQGHEDAPPAGAHASQGHVQELSPPFTQFLTCASASCLDGAGGWGELLFGNAAPLGEKDPLSLSRPQGASARGGRQPPALEPLSRPPEPPRGR